MFKFINKKRIKFSHILRKQIMIKYFYLIVLIFKKFIFFFYKKYCEDIHFMDKCLLLLNKNNINKNRTGLILYSLKNLLK